MLSKLCSITSLGVNSLRLLCLVSRAKVFVELPKIAKFRSGAKGRLARLSQTREAGNEDFLLDADRDCVTTVVSFLCYKYVPM